MAKTYTHEDKKNFFYRLVSALVPNGKPYLMPYMTTGNSVSYKLIIGGVKPYLYYIKDKSLKQIKLTKNITLLIWEKNNAAIIPRPGHPFSFDEFIRTFDINEVEFYNMIFKHFKALCSNYGQVIAACGDFVAHLNTKYSPEFKTWAELKIWVDVNGGVV